MSPAEFLTAYSNLPLNLVMSEINHPESPLNFALFKNHLQTFYYPRLVLTLPQFHLART